MPEGSNTFRTDHFYEPLLVRSLLIEYSRRSCLSSPAEVARGLVIDALPPLQVIFTLTFAVNTEDVLRPAVQEALTAHPGDLTDDKARAYFRAIMDAMGHLSEDFGQFRIFLELAAVGNRQLFDQMARFYTGGKAS